VQPARGRWPAAGDTAGKIKLDSPGRVAGG